MSDYTSNNPPSKRRSYQKPSVKLILFEDNNTIKSIIREVNTYSSQKKEPENSTTNP